MNSFYVSIIFLGITLIVVALVWIVYDIKKSNDYISRIDEKKEELREIIGDSEQMIEELNKLSDYIINQMEIKNEEMCNSLKVVEGKLKQLNQEIHADLLNKPEVNVFDFKSDLVEESIEQPKKPHSRVSKKNTVKGNVVALSNRHQEVLRLSENGMSHTEIAKALNMGKGEIQLILGMNKQ